MPEKRLFLPCQCVWSCTIAAVWELNDDAEEFPQFGIDFYEHVHCQRKVRDRLRVMWQVLRGREPYVHGLVLSRDQGHELATFLRPYNSIRVSVPSATGTRLPDVDSILDDGGLK